MDRTKPLPLYNPYDFANPVTQKKLFSGRKSELGEIRYYLNHAVYAPRPISLALIGNRASGKTSLLNIAELEAQQRTFCTVRIDLDQSHSRNELSFFAKFFHTIFFSALSFGVFEGLRGRTYETYIEMITANSVPREKTFCPFLFPIQYAKAKAANREAVELLDDSIKHDLIKIRDELDKPIVILMDECDVLIKNAPILQKLRNILMQLEGYMVIMAATPNLFPVLDDVFSPITRQLKRIRIEEFKSSDDSKKCMNRPLIQVDLDPAEVFSRKTYDEIHQLSGGRPYEINLICHVLYRRYQERPHTRMSLNAAVLEDIRSELDKSQRLSDRMVLQTIRELSKSELRTFGLLCRGNKSLTLEQIMRIERIFYQEKRHTSVEIQQLYTTLVFKKVLGTDSHSRIVFLGDEFERIYIKYFAKEQGVLLPVDQVKPAIIWTFYEAALLRKKGLTTRQIASFEVPRPSRNDVVEIVNMLQRQGSVNVFDKYRWLAVNVYWALVTDEEAQVVYILQIEVEFEWMSNVSWFRIPTDVDPDVEDRVSNICGTLASLVSAEGGRIDWQLLKIVPPRHETMLASVEEMQDDMIRSRIAHRHLGRAVNRYLEDKDRAAALWHARFCSRVVDSVDFDSGELNNLGYMFLSNEEYREAERILNLAVAASVREPSADGLLPLYNLGLTKLVLGETSSANEMLNNVAGGLGKVSSSRERLACLLCPRIEDGSILLEEEFDPEFDDVVVRALRRFGSL